MSESADENEIVADVIDTVREINEEAGIFSLLDLDPFIRRLKKSFSILGSAIAIEFDCATPYFT